MTLQQSPPAAALETPVPAAKPAPALVAGSNGAALPTPSRLPRARRGGKSLWLLLLLAVVLLLVGVGVAWAVWLRGPQARPDLVTYHVEYKDLQLKIVERGSLEAGHTYDVKCEVKTGSRGAAKIKWVVDNGVYVHEGDPLMIIDDSYLQEQAKAEKIKRDQAEADAVAARETEKKWDLGDFPQQQHDLQSKIIISRAVLQQQKDRTTWVGRMVKKGYMTASQESAEEDNLRGDQLSLQNYEEQLDILVKYTDEYNKKINKATVKSKEAIFAQEKDLYSDLEAQIKECKIDAPHSGIVVYNVPEQTRGGFGANQSVIAVGEPVTYGQTLMRIPDLSRMMVNLRIHEAFINYMKTELPCTVRVANAPGKLLKAHLKSVAAAAAQQDWMSPDVKVYQTYVEIDDSVEQLHLKPGLSADTTIYTESKAEHVLAVPVQAVLPPIEKGDKPHVFVMTPKGPEKRDVELGITDEKFIEVKEGLNDGDDIVLNPRALLSDKDKKVGGREDEKIVPTGGKGRQGGGDSAAPGGAGGGRGRSGNPKP